MLRVVSNLLNTSARPNVKDVASVTSLVLAAQQCAAVPVQMINAQCSVSPDSDFIGRFTILLCVFKCNLSFLRGVPF